MYRYVQPSCETAALASIGNRINNIFDKMLLFECPVSVGHIRLIRPTLLQSNFQFYLHDLGLALF